MHAIVNYSPSQECQYIAVGLHPIDRALIDKVAEASSVKGIVAIGEVGLDYSKRGYDASNRHIMFQELVRLVRARNLPLVIHCRDRPGASAAYKDCLRVLESELH